MLIEAGSCSRGLAGYGLGIVQRQRQMDDLRL